MTNSTPGNITYAGEEWEAIAQRLYAESCDYYRTSRAEQGDQALRLCNAANAIAQTVQLRRIGNKLDAMVGDGR